MAYERLCCLFCVFQSEIRTSNSVTKNIYPSNQKQIKKIFIFSLGLDLEDKFGKFSNNSNKSTN